MFTLLIIFVLMGYFGVLSWGSALVVLLIAGIFLVISASAQ